MVEIPTLIERGCVPLSCGEIFVVLLDIGEAFIRCLWVLRIVHAQNVYDHPIDDLCLAISLGMESYELVSLVSNIDQRLDQNVLRNLLS